MERELEVRSSETAWTWNNVGGTLRVEDAVLVSLRERGPLYVTRGKGIWNREGLPSARFSCLLLQANEPHDNVAERDDDEGRDDRGGQAVDVELGGKARSAQASR